jgi:hemerythrin-like metal-binding protein
MFSWTEDYSVKVTLFDHHHQRLFGMVNDLHDAMGAGKAKEVVIPILDELVRYVSEHFAAEEVLMTVFAYPALITHRMEHEQLTRKVREFVRAFAAGEVLLTIQLMDFLQNWLAHHILETDMKYSSFMVAKGAV